MLGKVVEVEHEIQNKLEMEKKKCRAWLEKITSETEEQVLREEQKLKESLKALIVTAKQQADIRATEVLRDAHATAETLGNLDDEILKRIILKHITRILPGEIHDSQDV